MDLPNPTQDDAKQREKKKQQQKLPAVENSERDDHWRKSVWDQFCDFTSMVGFRLLHSKHSLWLR
jgi:hypothetical protein